MSIDLRSTHLKHELLEWLDGSTPQEYVPSIQFLAIINVEALSSLVLDALIIRVVGVETVIPTPVQVLFLVTDTFVQDPDHAWWDVLAVS